MYKLKTVVPIIIISLLAGMFAFTASRYKSSTLVIQTRTLEKGSRQIILEDKGKAGIRRVDFEIGSDQGEPSFYALSLPRITLKTVKIPPLASAGKYEINRITLDSSTVSYNWDEQLTCTQQLLSQQIIRREACKDGTPHISLEKDDSIVISSIPESGFANSGGFRIGIAFLSAVGVFLGCLFMIRPLEANKSSDFLQRYSARAAWLAIILLYGYHFYLICVYAVDIPYWEEWEFFEPFGLPSGLTFQWLFHHLGSNQQIMVFTKLVAWLDYQFFKLHFVTIKIFNYLCYGCLLYAVLRFKIDLLGKERFRQFPFFILFLVSTIISEVHIASFLSGQTYMLLLAMGMLHYAIREEVSNRDTITCAILGLLAVYSLGAGMVIATVILFNRTVFLGAKIYNRQLDRQIGLQSILVAWGIVLPGILLWFIGFNKPAGSQKWLFPFELKYWSKFFNLLGFGFGFETENPLPGFACLLVMTIPLVMLLRRKTTRWQPTTWRLIAAVAGVMAILGQITLGRGNMPYSILIPHYAQFAFLLIPFNAISWWLAIEDGKWRAVILTTLYCVCFGAYLNNWDFNFYRDTRQSDLLNLECVERYASGSGDGSCTGTHALPIGMYFDNARKLDVNFTRQFRADSNDNLNQERSR